MNHRNKAAIERDIQRTKISIKRMKLTMPVLGMKGTPDEESKIHFLESELRLLRAEWTRAAVREAKL
ncbi:MAG: hypothetical protein ACI9WC_003015 [Arenicella sp.]|jgi:hypothetical protein